RFNLMDGHPVSIEDLDEPPAECPGNGNDDFITFADRVDHRRFKAGCAASGENHHVLFCSEHLFQARTDTADQFGCLAGAVADHWLRHGALHTRRYRSRSWNT